MGKPRKKTKSDRINALRKQYDAFLDEDKRRKDRNDFILGRLEKIRFYNAMVPVSHMGNSQINKIPTRPESYKKALRFDDNLLMRQRQMDVLPACTTKDEQKLLNDISKKYILIPKLQSNGNYVLPFYNPPSASNDADWKNKYSILEELKKIEKEPSDLSNHKSETTYHNFSENNDSCGVIDQENVIGYSSHKLQEITEREPVAEKHESKAIPENISNNNGDNQSQNDLNPNVVEEHDDNAVILECADSVYREQTFSDLNKSNEIFVPNEVVQKEYQTNEKNNGKMLNCNLTQDINLNIINQPDASNRDNNEMDETFTQAAVAEINNVEPISDSNIPMNLIEQNTEIVLNLETDEIPAQPIEQIESQKFIPESQEVINENQALTQENQEPIHEIQEPINEVQEPYQCEATSENISHQQYEANNETTIISENIITSQIDEFEAEQKEMFYSEETEYNQNVDNVEYNLPNEEYTNEQYSYYNQSEQDQPYYAEVNEHEEANERYDPNYEQQYVNDYEENVNVAHYESQQYGENYENHPEIPSDNYEPQSGNIENTHSEIPDNTAGLPSENVGFDESQSVENINYKTQHSAINGISEHATIPYDQNVIENPLEYTQMSTEQDTVQNLEKQLDVEDHIAIKDTVQSDPSAETNDLTEVQKSDIKVK